MANLDPADDVLAITVGADGTHNVQLLLRHLPPWSLAWCPPGTSLNADSRPSQAVTSATVTVLLTLRRAKP